MKPERGKRRFITQKNGGKVRVLVPKVRLPTQKEGQDLDLNPILSAIYCAITKAFNVAKYLYM